MFRYLELMSEQNVNFWGISTGNEPLNGVIGFLFVHFMSLGWTAINQVPNLYNVNFSLS